MGNVVSNLSECRSVVRAHPVGLVSIPYASHNVRSGFTAGCKHPSRSLAVPAATAATAATVAAAAPARVVVLVLSEETAAALSAASVAASVISECRVATDAPAQNK